MSLYSGTSAANEVNCLATVIHNEARGTNKQEQLLVAATVLARSKHEDFPDTICGVTRQKSQFAAEPAKVSPEIKKLAKQVLSGSIKLPKTKPLYFHANWMKRKPSWAKRKTLLKKTKYHHYYR